MGQSSGGGAVEPFVSTLAILAPASSDSIEEFLGRAYAKPLVGLYASNGEDWQASRDSVVRVLQGTPADDLESEARWFLAVHEDIGVQTAPLAGVLEYKDIDSYFGFRDLTEQLCAGLYLGFVGDQIMAHGSSCREVLEETISEGWAHLEQPTDYSKMSDLPSVKAMVESVRIVRMSP